VAQAGLAAGYNNLLELDGEEFASAVTEPLDEDDVIRGDEGEGAIMFSQLQVRPWSGWQKRQG
jgi:hypothetical protein